MTQQKPFCTKCGARFKSTASKFCIKCGKAVIDKATATEQVFLDSLDGFGFESLCQRIFEKAGWGRVERIGGVSDAGRDLIIHGNKGKIVVECKHQPNTSQGRPIVQKLHSAVTTAGTNMGIIVSTGGFSDKAKQYAHELSKQQITIQLFDLHKLAQIAQSGGIELSTTDIDLRIHTFPLLADHDLVKKFLGYITSFESKPTPVKNLFKLMKPTVTYVPAYESIVSINEDFSTSIAIVHQIHEDNVSYFLDSYGKIFSEFSRCIGIHNSTIVHKGAYKDTGFNLDNKSIRSEIKQTLIQRKTITVQYQASKNNRIYTKTCIPKESNIEIHDINKILLPQYRLNFNILRNQYSCGLLETRNRLNITDADLFDCKICRGKIDGTIALLCNSCGIIAHNSESKTECSHLCEICGKTICKNCAYYTRKYLVMKKIMCEPCAKQNTKKTSKLN